MMTRGKHPALPLTVNERIHSILERHSRKRTIPVWLSKRIKIVVDGIAGKSKYSSSKELGLEWNTVDKWRKRWEEHIEVLMVMEKQGISGTGEPAKDHEILKEIIRILSNKSGQGNPGRISLSQKEQIVALACEDPEKQGIPMTNWTHQMLAHVAISKGIVDNISSRHVGNILKKNFKTSQIKILAVS
jgi:hypothetical protein